MVRLTRLMMLWLPVALVEMPWQAMQNLLNNLEWVETRPLRLPAWVLIQMMETKWLLSKIMQRVKNTILVVKSRVVEMWRMLSQRMVCPLRTLWTRTRVPHRCHVLYRRIRVCWARRLSPWQINKPASKLISTKYRHAVGQSNPCLVRVFWRVMRCAEFISWLLLVNMPMMIRLKSWQTSLKRRKRQQLLDLQLSYRVLMVKVLDTDRA